MFGNVWPEEKTETPQAPRQALQPKPFGQGIRLVKTELHKLQGTVRTHLCKPNAHQCALSGISTRNYDKRNFKTCIINSIIGLDAGIDEAVNLS